MLKSDFFLMRKLQQKYRREGIKHFGLKDFRELKDLKSEFRKIFPFYAIFLLPFGSLFVPFYILHFPNSMPQHLMTDQMMIVKQQDRNQRQRLAFEQLFIHFEKQIKKFEVNLNRSPSEFEVIYNKIQLKKTLKNEEEIFLENDFFNFLYYLDAQKLVKLDFQRLASDQLIDILDFLAFDYLKGTYLINRLYQTIVNIPRYLLNMMLWISRSERKIIWTHWIFNKQFKYNYYPFEYFKKQFLIFQINYRIQSLQEEDYLVARIGSQLQELSSTQIELFLQERGQIGRQSYQLFIEKLKNKEHQFNENIYLWFLVANSQLNFYKNE